MGVAGQNIKDAETEADELQKILRQVGCALRESTARKSKNGLTYAQVKERALKHPLKVSSPSHAAH